MARRVRQQRRPRPHGRPRFSLVALIPEFVMAGAAELARAFSALREHLADPREIAARLVDAHGPRIRLALHEHRDLPDVAACFAPSSVSSDRLLAEARALVQRIGARRAAVALARRYGLGVFDALNRHTATPKIHALLGLPPHRAAHRPKHSTSHDLESFAVAEMIDALKVPRADLLRALGRNPQSSTGPWYDRREAGDWKWLRRRLTRGRAVRKQRSAVERSPEELTITFMRRYLPGLPRQARLAPLIRFLVDAVPAAQRKRVAVALEALTRD